MIQVRRVQGDSMLPAYKHRQIIIIAELKKPRVGDVVMAVQNCKEVLKRIHSVTNEWQVELRGDNHTKSTDSRQLGAVPLRNVLGVVVWPKRPLK